MWETRSRKLLGAAAALLLGAPVAACANASAAPGSTADNVAVGTPDTTVLALHFEPTGDTQTSCGEAYGVHVAIQDSEGNVQECTQPWAPAQVSDATSSGEHLVADCFFVVAAGSYDIQTVEAVGVGGDPLSCCSSDYPETAVVSQGQTTEFGAQLTCDLPDNGALDIYGTLNRPPVIKALSISPSKFARTCDVVTLDAEAVDGEGDPITYLWSIEDGPWTPGDQGPGGVIKSIGNGPQAYFAADRLGTYTIVLEAMDSHGASTSLTFPIHVTQAGEQCSPAAVVDGMTGDGSGGTPDEPEGTPGGPSDGASD